MARLFDWLALPGDRGQSLYWQRTLLARASHTASRALSPDEAVRLVAIGDDSPLGLRDRAALHELAYSCGLRVSELAGLDWTRSTNVREKCA